MQKPHDFETAQGYTDFEALELGGHICRIMSLEEVKSSLGKDMIKVSLDIAEGKQANYYSNQYKNNTKADKKWGCIVYQLVLDSEGNTNKGFKTFIDAVEKSNTGFVTQWGANFGDQFKGKLIGGVFGREQYKNANQELKFITKCMSFKTVEQIRKGVPVPKDKLLQGAQAQAANSTPFVPTTYTDDDDLPF